MRIHELPGDPGRRQKRKRVGRGKGSGQGGRAGKGNKGQQARAGGSKSQTSGFEGGQMPLHRRLPKRGFINPNRVEYQVVNLGQLNEAFKDGETVNRESLLALGLISNARRPVKLLGKGELERSKLAVTVDRASSSAAKALADKGGSCDAVIGKKAPANPPRRASAAAADDESASA